MSECGADKKESFDNIYLSMNEIIIVNENCDFFIKYIMTSNYKLSPTCPCTHST